MSSAAKALSFMRMVEMVLKKKLGASHGGCVQPAPPPLVRGNALWTSYGYVP